MLLPHGHANQLAFPNGATSRRRLRWAAGVGRRRGTPARHRGFRGISKITW